VRSNTRLVKTPDKLHTVRWLRTLEDCRADCLAAFHTCVAVDWGPTDDPDVSCEIHFASDFDASKDLMDYAEVHSATTLYQLNSTCLR